MKLAIITTHPIQYNSPFFRLLANRETMEIKVFYTWGKQVMEKKYDPGFQKEIQWDVPLLNGYDYEWVENISRDPGSHHFYGIKTPHLNNSIKQWGADAVLVYGWNFSGHLSVLRYFKGKIPVWFRGDSTLLNRDVGSLIERVKKYYLKWVYKHIDHAFYVGSENKKYFKWYGMYDSQLTYAPHAVENERFEKATDLNTIRNEFKIPDDSVLFLFAGKFDSIKNLFHLLDSFSKIADNNAYLLLVGMGKQELEMMKMVDNFPLNIKQRIKFSGFVNQQQMPVVFASCDVYILPSISETWGLSVNEAMACGKAIIVSDRCGCATDLIEYGVNGFVFSNNDKEDLVKKMELIISREYAKKLGDNSLEKIKAFNLLLFVEALEKELLNVRKIH